MVTWKRGRGRLGAFDPLLGQWAAEGDSPMGRVRCTRRFERVLGGAWIRAAAHWQYAASAYEELALIGLAGERRVGFWSFTSDGKHAQGLLVDATDLHPQALAFEAEMPAGRARSVYWPEADGALVWVAEAQSRRGWRRMVEHCYRRVDAGAAG